MISSRASELSLVYWILKLDYGKDNTLQFVFITAFCAWEQSFTCFLFNIQVILLEELLDMEILDAVWNKGIYLAFKSMKRWLTTTLITTIFSLGKLKKLVDFFLMTMATPKPSRRDNWCIYMINNAGKGNWFKFN